MLTNPTAAEIERGLETAAWTVRKYARGRDLASIGVDVEDLEQEARLRAWLQRERWDPARGASFATFAGMCGLRQALSLVYRASTHPTVSLDERCSTEDETSTRAEFIPDPRALAALEAVEWEGLLASLPAPEQAVIRSIVWEGRSWAETIEQLGVGRTVVWRRFRRGLNLLRVRLEAF